MSLASQIESVQPDVYYKLLSEPWYQNIAIFRVREKQLDTQVNKALAGLAGRNGKGGATIEVLYPTLKAALANTAGPVCTLEQRFYVKEQRTVNRGANGTGLAAEAIAVNLAQTLQLFFLGGALNGFYPAPVFHREVDPGNGAPYFMLEVTMHATFALTPVQRTSQPCLAENSPLTVTLTDTQPGGGSTIYYTTDGSFPGPGNPGNGGAGTQIYSGPFAVAAGTVVRCAAWNGSLQGSMVGTYTIT
jgi:hypothetical protein